MSELWDEFKSCIRNRLQLYYGPDVTIYIHNLIQKIEPDGFAESIAKHKINLNHLFPLLRWSFIYGEISRKISKPFTNTAFNQLYNGMVELGQRQIPRELSSSIRVNSILRESTRNQLVFQTDPLRIFLVFATIVLKYCERKETNQLADLFGLHNIEEFILAHYLITVYPVLNKEYTRDFKHFSTLKDTTFLRQYIDTFIPNTSDYAARVQNAHENNKKNDQIWKEIDDMSWFIWNPMVKLGDKIIVLSLTALGHYSSYGFLSKLSTDQKWFYQDSFAKGFEKFVTNILSTNGKNLIREEQIKELLSIKDKGGTPDALIETDDRAIFIEFKSNKPPRYTFEFFNQESIQSSVGSSVHKGMTQIFNAMKLYKEKHPEKEVRGLVLTLHEYHCGIPSIFAKEVLSQVELDEYSEFINSFGICSLHDMLPFAEMPRQDFMNVIFNKIAEPNFYLLANSKWRNSDSKELLETLNHITKLAAARIDPSHEYTNRIASSDIRNT